MIDMKNNCQCERSIPAKRINIETKSYKKFAIFKYAAKYLVVSLVIVLLARGIYIQRYKKIQSLILSFDQANDLFKLCEFDSKANFKLLYRASKDGFENKIFHSKCDGITNTLTIIKDKDYSNVFGGYTSLYWDTFGYKSYFGYKEDPEAFIFSLINKPNVPKKINVSFPSRAIYCDENYGPTFGEESIVISNGKGYSQLDDVYQSSVYPRLATSYNFIADEIEVFEVLN